MLKKTAKQIRELLKELELHKNNKERFIQKLKDLKKLKKEIYGIELKKVLKDKTEKEWLEYYNRHINELLDKINLLNNQIKEAFQPEIKEEVKETVTVPVKKTKFDKLDRKTRKKYLKELKIEKDILKRVVSPKKERVSAKQIEYTVYTSSKYGQISNSFVEKLTLALTRKYPKFFEYLYHSLRSSDTKILSKTYISIMIFSSFLAFLGILIISALFAYFSNLNIVFTLIKGVSLAFLGFVLTFAFIYLYPSMVVNKRRREIKNDLPFVIIYMAAVAGSGAQPISMFNLILSTEEYKGLESEIRKIVNYVNLFGYDLSTALRTVATTTPSPEFRELLTGIVATVESGGNLKSYLKSKAADAMTTYKLERKKYVEVLSTYSDIYTGILIAAPLLFIVTLAIINILGGRIGFLSVKTLAQVGTYGVIPVLNLAYILFLSLIQPEV